MNPPAIRPARADEYDEVARVWMDSWVSTGFGTASEELLGQLRERIPAEVANGWSLYVADDDGALAAMLALHVPNKHLDQLFVAPQYHGRSIGRTLLAFHGTLNPSAIPSTVILDKQGRVAASILGEIPSEQTLVDLARDVQK